MNAIIQGEANFFATQIIGGAKELVVLL